MFHQTVKIFFSYKSVPELATLSMEERKAMWSEASKSTTFFRATFHPSVVAIVCIPAVGAFLSMLFKEIPYLGETFRSVVGGMIIGLLLGIAIANIRLRALSAWIKDREIIQNDGPGMTTNPASIGS